MARILCFSDTIAVAFALEQGRDGKHDDVHVLSASSLSDQTRERARQLNPDVIVLEVTRTLDNPHIFIFLRSDQSTRMIPIILVSTSNQIALHAEILGADSYVHNPFDTHALWQQIEAHLPHEQAVYAA
ncbi:MAG: hypothetical protein GFH27_549291n182 [Chloroflexi bacterium AL-W]|nr:hypothetical protein [Chloroflexi bacterium AL-N1]NOK67352.1 hypothetical protein [Chloroflexi bacterium AL-N10]NOK75156.1 hypothetical protein [Chloroflexi bacterium AL-N5]NOK81944.1 hypothetical protein [Chloroflexi bacterium AL-W]NOK89789.1 hypothetical protein [Chloroflexi bacterium AL-N15]